MSYLILPCPKCTKVLGVSPYGDAVIICPQCQSKVRLRGPHLEALEPLTREDADKVLREMERELTEGSTPPIVLIIIAAAALVGVAWIVLGPWG